MADAPFQDNPSILSATLALLGVTTRARSHRIYRLKFGYLARSDAIAPDNHAGIGCSLDV